MHLQTPVIAAIAFSHVWCGAAPLAIEAVNSLSLARSAQTLEITAADLAPFGAKDLNLVHLQDAAGNEILCQVIDLDGDALRKSDAVIFQADFAAGETQTFTATVGGKPLFKKEQYKAFTRPGQAVELTPAIGLKKDAGGQVEANAVAGWLVKWEKMEKGAGNLGPALITRPETFVNHTEDALNQLVISKRNEQQAADCRAGFCWGKDPAFSSAAARASHVDVFARSLAAPIRVTVKP
jgi:hypothetical protein